jgi:hypothetical protein
VVKVVKVGERVGEQMKEGRREDEIQEGINWKR